jgi:hypothetical protein
VTSPDRDGEDVLIYDYPPLPAMEEWEIGTRVDSLVTKMTG